MVNTLTVVCAVMVCEQKEVEEMIWEVDEGLDGAVHWDEFKLMFEVRARRGS